MDGKAGRPSKPIPPEQVTMTQSSDPHHPSSTSYLAALAVSAQGRYGAVTDLARQHGIRRQEVYALRERARSVTEIGRAHV